MNSYEPHEIYEYLRELIKFLYSRVLLPDAYLILICVNIFAFLVIITGAFFYFTRLHYGNAIKSKHFTSCDAQAQEEEKFKNKRTRNNSDKSQRKHSGIKQNYQPDKAVPYNKIDIATGFIRSTGELESNAGLKSLTVSEILTYLKSTKLNDVQMKQISDIILHKDAQQSFFDVNESPQCIMKDQATMTEVTDCIHTKLKNLTEVQYNCHTFQEFESHLKTDELNANRKKNTFRENVAFLEQCMSKLNRTHEMEVQKWKLRKAALLQKIELSEGCQKEKELSYKLLLYKLENVHSFCLSLLDDQSDQSQRYEKLLSEYSISENSKKELQTKFNQWKNDQAKIIENLKREIVCLKQSNVEYNEKYKKLKDQCKSKENVLDVQRLVLEITKSKQILSYMFPDIRVNSGLDCCEWFIQFGEKVLTKINKLTESTDAKVQENMTLLDMQLIDMGGKVENLIQEKMHLEDQVQRQKHIIIETDSLISDVKRKIQANENLRAEKLLSLEETLLKVIELCQINYKEHVDQQVTPPPVQFDEIIITRLNNALCEIQSLKGPGEVHTSKRPIHARQETDFEEQQISSPNECIQSASFMPPCCEKEKIPCNKNESMQPTPIVTRPQEEQPPFNPNGVGTLPKLEKRKKNKKKRQDKK